MNIIKWIAGNYDFIIAVIAIVAAIITAIRKGETSKLKTLIFKLVTDAEIMFGAQTGILKAAYVAEKLYELMPTFIRCLFTAKQIEEIIDEVLTSAKAKWEANSALRALIGTGDTTVSG